MKVRRALERSWSKKTSECYDPDIAPLSYGQCAPTAVVVYETFGGMILKTDIPDNASGLHFYNCINDQRYDFTADQFEEVVKYKDIPSNDSEAAVITTGRQLDEMRYAFKSAWKKENAV